MVGHDERNLDRQVARVLAAQQFFKCVRRFRTHDESPQRRARVPHIQIHLELLSNRAQLSCNIVSRKRHIRFDAHEERTGLLRTVLLGLNDVAASLEQRAGHVVHDAGLIWAGQGHHNPVVAVHIAVLNFAAVVVFEFHRLHDSGGGSPRWHSLSC